MGPADPTNSSLLARLLRSIRSAPVVRASPYGLSPMDESTWMWIQRTELQIDNGTGVLVQANPMRLELLIAPYGQLVIDTQPPDEILTQYSGITVSPSIAPGYIRFTQASDGLLCQTAWYYSQQGMGAIPVWVYELLLKDWPK